MKSIKFIVIALVAAIALISAGVAMASVVGTSHDMTQIATQTGATAGTSEVCVYCHTPHGANITEYTAPLWNKANVTGTYQPYSSPTIDGTVSATITGVTKACLSCHDGSLAVFSMLNPPNSGGYVTGMTGPDGNLSAAGLMTGNPQIDWDFRNDHPVGITYDTTDTGLANPAPTNTPLIGGQVECASCHNVHDDTNAPFLRIANTASAMCTNCHINK